MERWFPYLDSRFHSASTKHRGSQDEKKERKMGALALAVPSVSQRRLGGNPSAFPVSILATIRSLSEGLRNSWAGKA